ncbi:Transmembrane ascorbate ferrireductase 1 [Zea mays]|uniref:Transmembrane ascorbate ferrireductase 1 n=1 Tax=Zea mays TaxID=4577 RepID=A0A1D6KRB0_MAIZE|nr:Transmembrane ascorbate ferrireductase 1 [Zea mays]
MAVPAPAKAARLLAASAAVLVLLWCVHFRGGLSFGSPTNKGLIFNVHPVLMLIGFIILGSEAIMSYKIWPWSHDTNKMVHMLLHAVALFLGSVGIYAAFKFHNESGIDNLYSSAGELHSSCDPTAWRFCCSVCHRSNAQ